MAFDTFQSAYYGEVYGNGEPNYLQSSGFAVQTDSNLESGSFHNDDLCPGNPPQIQRYLDEPSRTFCNPGQLWPDSNSAIPQQHFPLYGPESYCRSTSPVSLHHSSVYGSDTFFDGTPGPSTPGDTCMLSPRLDHVYMPDGCKTHLSLTGLHDPSETQLGQTAQVCDYEDSHYINKLETKRSNEPTLAFPYYPMLSESPEFALDDIHEEAPSLSTEEKPATFAGHEASSQQLTMGEIIVMPRTSTIITHPRKQARNGKRQTHNKVLKAMDHRGPKRSPRPASSIHGAISRQLSIGNILRCTQCHASCKDQAALEKHIKALHTRPFICVFHYAGCEATFATKNEWKRHVASQHLCLTYYHCTHDNCAEVKAPALSRRSHMLPMQGKSFNRKDLYDQHVRRMHTPPLFRKKPTSHSWEERVKEMQRVAHRERCKLPVYMQCPAPGCCQEFNGSNAWDDRMEHVARHLENAAMGKELPVRFGGDHDRTLSDWAESSGVEVVRRSPNGWELSNQIKSRGANRQGVSGEVTLDEDAEGEEC